MNKSRLIRKLFLNKARQISLYRLCLIFLIFTFLLTAYLYGLIEIDSHRLVINIAPNKNSPNLLKLNLDNDYVNDRNLIINLNENIIIDDSNLIKSGEKHRDNLVDSYFSKELERNITNLFLSVERAKFRIRKSLKDEDFTYYSKLKESYENLVVERHEKVKSELKKELERINKEENADQNVNNVNNNNNNDEDDDDEDDETKNIKMKTLLSPDEYVTRQVFVNILKLEKTKRSTKQVKTVKDLLDKFDSNDEFNIR